MKQVVTVQTLPQCTSIRTKQHESLKGWCFATCRRIISCSGLHGAQVKLLSQFAQHTGNTFVVDNRTTAPPECAPQQSLSEALMPHHHKLSGHAMSTPVDDVVVDVVVRFLMLLALTNGGLQCD